MNKIYQAAIGLFLIAWSIPSSQAVLFNSTAWPKLEENQTGPLGEVTIVAEEDNEITLAKSLTFGLDSALFAVFNVDIKQISIAGSAVENGKIDSQATPLYSLDGKWVTIPLTQNLDAEETVVVTGLQIRSYEASRGNYSLLLDLGFDEILDGIINYNISIDEDNNRDPYAPYPMSDITLQNGVISWRNGPDLDKNYIDIDITRNEAPFYHSQLPKDISEYELTTYDIGDTFNVQLKMWDITGNSSDWAEASFIIEEETTTQINDNSSDQTEPPSSNTSQYEIILQPQTEIKNNLASKFYDVDLNDNFIDYLAVVSDKVEIDGYKANKRRIFGKDKNISRAELLKIILDASEINTEDIYQKPFEDIFLSFWGAHYINKAKNLGIVSGYADGNFYPDREISVAESIKIALETFSVAEIKEIENLDSEETHLLENNSINATQWYSPYYAILLQYSLEDSLHDLDYNRQITREEIIKLAANILSIQTK